MSFTEADVQGALKNLTDPNTRKDFISSKSVKNIKINGSDVSLDILLGYPAKSVWDEIQKLVEAHLKSALPGSGKISVNVSSKVVPHAVQRGVKLVDGVKNIIAVASGKGGVGKSTTAVNLALALAAEGARVGILDADIYGPSQPTMLGITGQPVSKDGKSMEAMEGHGIQAMSIGFMIEGDDAPMVWRGPMVTQALEQLLRQTRWDNLDYLVIDLPPGTGDIQLTLAQKVPVTGAVIVTTPQDIALLDAKKRLEDVREGGREDHRHRGKHEYAYLFQVRTRRTHFWRRRRRENVRGLQGGIPRRSAAGYPDPRAGRLRQADRCGRS